MGALALVAACTWDIPSGIPCDTDRQCPAAYYCSGVDEGRRGTCLAATPCTRSAQFHKPCSASLGECHRAGVYACAASSPTPVCNAICLAASSASVPPRGTLTFTAAGGSASGWTWSLAPNRSGGSIDRTTGAYQAGDTGNVVDVVKVVDSVGDGATADVSVGPPLTIAPAHASTPPRGSVSFLARGGSGAGLTWSLASGNSGGTIDPATGSYTAGETGNVTDTVEALDSLGNVATAKVDVGPSVTLAPVNPSTTPRGTVSFSATGGSEDGFTWSLSADRSGGSVDAATGSYTAGPTGSVTDTVQVVDSLGNTGTTGVTVSAGVSVAPSNPSTPPLGALTFSAAGGSGSGFQWSLATNASGGAIDSATGSYAAGPQGGVTDVVQVQDSLGNVATTEVTVTPGVSIAPAAPTTPPGGSVGFVATGGSGEGYLWSLSKNGSGAGIDPSTGAYRAGHQGGVADVVQVVDSFGNAASATVTVTPSLAIVPQNPSTPLGGTIAFTATGGSGDGLIWSLPVPASGGAIDSSTGIYQAGGTKGGVVDTVQAVDSFGNTASTQVWVTRGVRLMVKSGDGQKGTVAVPLGLPLVVEAVDEDGFPAMGAGLSWTAQNGSSFASRPPATTGEDGTASVELMLPRTAGLVRVLCDSPKLRGSPVVFAVVAEPGPPRSLEPVSGDNQFTTAGQKFGGAFTVRVTDAYSNPVGQVPVQFEAVSGGGSIAPTAVTTDGAGLAQATMTAGTAASQSFSASSCGFASCPTPLDGSPITLPNLWTTPQASATIALAPASNGSGQTSLAGSELTDPLVVQAQVSGVSTPVVYWGVVSGGGSVSQPTSPVSGGQAQMTVTLGPEVGQQIFTATLPGAAPAVVEFEETANRQPVALLKSVSGDVQAEPGGTLPDPLEVLVLDAFGSPVVGAPIQFAPAAGGSVSPSAEDTDANGYAQTTATLGSAPGDQVFKAAVVDGASVSFTETDNAAKSVAIEPADSTQSVSSTPLRFHALAVYSDGSQVDVTDQTSWSVPGVCGGIVAPIANDPPHRGVIRLVGPGSCQIIAKYEGLMGTTMLTVQN